MQNSSKSTLYTRSYYLGLRLNNKVLKDNNYNQDKLVREDFGMQVWQQPTAIEARVLPPPSLKYHGSGPQSEVTPFVGAWNMKILKLFSGGTVNYWAVVNFSRQRQQVVDGFVDGIIAMCIDRGMVFDRPLIETRHAPSHNIEKALVDVELQCLTELTQRALGKSLQLLIVILPDMKRSYGLVKIVLETDLGIVSQCCQPKHVTMANRQYFVNLSMKINVKVGGVGNYNPLIFV
uniref:Argonaute/Dicer protein, PAZ n=1 Tax=Tanacetum cinerariifolium TaxID=118510 RepID=A0A6L2MHK8_TANCI|nr:argonaute/Dicer protein, PAZ [Tanacetum cinerariifolium]